MANADKFVHPTRYTGEYPNGFNGYTFLQWSKEGLAFHPGDDYNFGYGNDDLNQDVVATASGIVVHTSKSNSGYGNIIVLKHTLGYNMKRFLKEVYGMETDVLYSLYAHLSEILVAVGNEINGGALIGRVGNSGTTWAHLHFEIYKAIPDTDWRFWPYQSKGWTEEKIKEYWLPPYKFIESTKNIESYFDFLGKPKEYWEQLEKDKVDLLKQLSDKDKVISELNQDWQRIVTDAQNAEKQAKEESAKKDELLKQADILGQTKAEEFRIKEVNYQSQINSLKAEKLDLLKKMNEGFSVESISKYILSYIEKFAILIYRGFKSLKKGGKNETTSNKT